MYCVFISVFVMHAILIAIQKFKQTKSTKTAMNSTKYLKKKKDKFKMIINENMI